jgi:hypothetical protein
LYLKKWLLDLAPYTVRQSLGIEVKLCRPAKRRHIHIYFGSVFIMPFGNNVGWGVQNM